MRRTKKRLLIITKSHTNPVMHEPKEGPISGLGSLEVLLASTVPDNERHASHPVIAKGIRVAPIVKSVIGDNPDNGGRYFGAPQHASPPRYGDLDREASMHLAPPSHMSSNLMRFVHSYINNFVQEQPGKKITPSDVLKKVS